MNDQGPKKVDETAAIREGIERTRGEMSATVNKIEERLSPAHIEEQVADLKQSVLGSYHEAKDHLKEDLSRELLEAKEKVKDELLEVKEKVQHEISDARTAVRDATVGKVENMIQEACAPSALSKAQSRRIPSRSAPSPSPSAPRSDSRFRARIPKTSGWGR